MERDELKRSEEEIKREKEAQDSELTDQDLENVAGGGHGGPSFGGGNTTQPVPPVSS
jgi:hypothetical protein